MRGLGRRIQLLATVAALSGLLAPPCALACLVSLDVDPSAAELAESPCHGQDSDAMPSEVPSSHEDCGCEFTYEVLLPGSAASSSVGTLVVIFESAPWQPLAANTHWTLTVPKDSDLPSPDILLLKSTLLI